MLRSQFICDQKADCKRILQLFKTNIIEFTTNRRISSKTSSLSIKISIRRIKHAGISQICLLCIYEILYIFVSLGVSLMLFPRNQFKLSVTLLKTVPGCNVSIRLCFVSIFVYISACWMSFLCWWVTDLVVFRERANFLLVIVPENFFFYIQSVRNFVNIL